MNATARVALHTAMRRAFLVLAVVAVLSACAGPRLPPSNNAIADYTPMTTPFMSWLVHFSPHLVSP